MKKFSLGAALFLAVAMVLHGQDRMLEPSVQAVPRPAGHNTRGVLPRSVLLLQVQASEKEHGEGRWLSFLYDPSNPKLGARMVDEARVGTYYRFLTPLFGGIGVAIAHEQELGKEGKQQMLWMDLLKGQHGPSIASKFGMDWSDGSNFFYESPEALHYLDAAKGEQTNYPISLKQTERIGEHLLLGITSTGGRRRVVTVDVHSGALNDFGELPEGLQEPGREYDPLSPMGEAARDGVAYVKELTSTSDNHFELWSKPTDMAWRCVLKDVLIWKTFGGAAAWLPFVYLGNQRFAVAQTILQAPRTESTEAHLVPEGSCLTMLVDGVTGQVLEKTKPRIYNHNPRLDIPDGWWSQGEVASRKSAAALQSKPIGFQWNEKARRFCFPGGRAVPGSENASISGDSRMLAIAEDPPKTKSPWKRLPVKILDGKTGTAQRFWIRVKALDASIQTSEWQLLFSASPSPAELRSFVPASPDLFYGPWR